MKDEHLGVGALLRDPFRSRQSLLVCCVFVTAGIAVEMVQENVSELQMHQDKQKRLTQSNSPADYDWSVCRNPIT